MPLTPDTTKLVDERALSLLKPTAYLISTARGAIVDEAALYNALKNKRIAGAAMDVFEIEPTPSDNPILELDNVVVLPTRSATPTSATGSSPKARLRPRLPSRGARHRRSS